MKNNSRNLLVSVGFPTYNRAHLLKRSLGSLLAQTHQNIEFIVSDNASTDDTEQIVRLLTGSDERVRYIRQKVNIGGIKNHEFVLKQARGEYFMWASDDDWWDPRFVEKLVEALETHKDYGVAMSHYKIVFMKDGQAVRKINRTHNFTGVMRQEMFRYHLRGNKTPIFFFGLFRTNILKSVMARGTAISYQGPHLFLSEIVLVTRFYSVSLCLHTRFQNLDSRINRHPTHPFALAEEGVMPVTHHLFYSLYWLLTSPAIPWKRKMFIWRPWFERVWNKKHKVAREIGQTITHYLRRFIN